MDEPSVLAVFAAALVTALATGLGAVPFLFVAHPTRSWLGVANASAAGFMIAASALLFYEGARESFLLTAGGVLLASSSWPGRRDGWPAGRASTSRRSQAQTHVGRFSSLVS